MIPRSSAVQASPLESVVAERRLASRRHRANFSFSRVAMETGNDVTLIEPLPVHRWISAFAAS
jgi:hypothetical protein